MMGKKIHIGVVLALVLVSVSLASAVSVVIYIHRGSRLIGDLSQRAGQYARLENIDEIVRSGFFGEIDSEKLSDGLAEGYVKGLDDPYSFYVKPNEYKHYENIMDGKSTGEEELCYYSVDGCIGYIRLAGICNSTPEKFASAVKKLQKSTVTGIILDLRNCASYNLDAASEIVDMIVPLGSEGTCAIYTAKNEVGEILKVYPSDASSLSLGFAVLVNDRTQCAAELVACDLRDFGKAVLIGERTAGHGKMQKLFKLKDGGGLLLSVAEIYPYTSGSFDGVGVEPDMKVAVSEKIKDGIGKTEKPDDEQYKRAVSYFSGK